jgi:hypothetical protein
MSSSKNRKLMTLSNKSNIREDGGGTRGYWTLLVLQRLVEVVEDDEFLFREAGMLGQQHAANSYHPEPCPKSLPQYANQFLPCHYFDIICGSGTGAYVHPTKMTTPIVNTT